MKRIVIKLFLIIFISVILVHRLSAQTYLKVTPDSVRVVNGELIIDNSTSMVEGPLINNGSGITKFQQLQLANVGDSAIAIIGQDTLEWANAALETVETINDLEEYNGRADVVIVKDTLRGGVFYKSNADLVADSGVVFNSVGGEYWVREYSGPINVLWYGARPDSTTDNNLAFNRALATKKEVEIPSGNYFTREFCMFIIMLLVEGILK